MATNNDVHTSRLRFAFCVCGKLKSLQWRQRSEKNTDADVNCEQSLLIWQPMQDKHQMKWKLSKSEGFHFGGSFIYFRVGSHPRLHMWLTHARRTPPPSKTVTKNFPFKHTSFLLLFFLKKGRQKSFLRGHWYPCFDFWWHLLWVSKQGWIPVCFIACTCNEFLGFTSGATPADFLATNMAAKPFWFTYLCTSIGVDLSCRCLIACDKTDAVATELRRLVFPFQ